MLTLFHRLAILACSLMLLTSCEFDQAQRERPRLRSEFELIGTLPGVRVVGTSDDSKFGQASVGATYQSSQTEQAIRSYYDAAFARTGWRQTHDRQLVGVRLHCYAKGDYTAGLEYNVSAQSNWTFAVHMAWGQAPCS